jgi:hypothetical protein
MLSAKHSHMHHFWIVDFNVCLFFNIFRIIEPCMHSYQVMQIFSMIDEDENGCIDKSGLPYIYVSRNLALSIVSSHLYIFSIYPNMNRERWMKI